VTIACLKATGTVAVDKDKLTILVMIDARVRVHFFSNVVGIGSSRQCLPSEFIIKLAVSSSIAAAKPDKKG